MARVRAGSRAGGAPHPPRRAAGDARTGLLRRLLAVRAGLEARGAARYDQEQDVRRPRPPARGPGRRRIRGIVDTESHELIAGYALDALDDADRARAEALLESSEEAREELRAYSDVATAMATAVSGPAPPHELRERILGAVRAEPQHVVSLDERRRARAGPVLAGCAALAACAAT